MDIIISLGMIRHVLIMTNVLLVHTTAQQLVQHVPTPLVLSLVLVTLDTQETE